MAFKVTVSVLSEGQEGDIGDDWRFELNVKAFNEGLKGAGTLKIKKHHLPALVSLTPKPRVNLTRFHAVFAPYADIGIAPLTVNTVPR